MYLTQTKAKLQLGQALVLHIDPRKVTHHAGSKFPISKIIEQKLNGFPKLIRKGASQLSTRYHPFVLAEDALPPVIPIELLEKDRRIKDFLSSSHYSDSLWYRSLLAELSTKGKTRHKNIKITNQDELNKFFESYVWDLVASMRRDGYVERAGADTGTAFILSNGVLVKSASADHRFLVARQLGVSNFPLIVMGVCRGWLEHTGTTIEHIGPALHDIAKRYR
jgi:hypothetical protein